MDQTKAVPFTEDFKPTQRHTVFKADSFEAWQATVLPKQMMYLSKRVPLGDKLYYHKTVPMTETYRPGGFFTLLPERTVPTSIKLLPNRNYFYSFDRPTTVPVLCKAGPHGEPTPDVWMSLAPGEILSQRHGLKRAKGKVLVGGLGMGWFVERILQRPQVTSVTVFEQDRNVAAYFGTRLLEMYRKLEIVVADAYTARFENYDSILFDIWEEYGDADCQDFTVLRLKYPGKVWGWGMGQIESWWADRLRKEHRIGPPTREAKKKSVLV